MDANEREPANPDHDPLREYALQNAAKKDVKPPSQVIPFLVSVLVTAIILGAAFFLWGR